MTQDFDFLIGSWKIHNRFLKQRLCGCTEWMEFEARYDVELILNGLGNLGRYHAVRDDISIHGVSLRLFHPARNEWSIYWSDTVRPGVLLPPMIGRFHGDQGEFFGDEEMDGKKILCRFHWIKSSGKSPRWEQAFSADGGKTWETNWIMTFTREEGLIYPDPESDSFVLPFVERSIRSRAHLVKQIRMQEA